MIPYFRFTSIPLGPISVQVWGLAVATGILVALLLARRLAVRAKLDGENYIDLALWVLVPAVLFARLGFVIFYGLTDVLANPLSIWRLWDGGMSSFGGYFGAAVGAGLFVRRKKILFRPYAEVTAFVLPLGYGIGRIGCFLIHDHPGILNSSFLSVNFPTGPRLDHGLLLSLFGFVLFGVFCLLRRSGWEVDADRWRYLPLLLVTYGTYRFMLDFFRAWDLPNSDSRFLYLAPSQYGAIVLVLIGIYLFAVQKKINQSIESA
ncbi:MAG: prolipoprotein diacylglyceryl transferase family protein [Patescibacteria group bacterium]